MLYFIITQSALIVKTHFSKTRLTFIKGRVAKKIADKVRVLIRNSHIKTAALSSRICREGLCAYRG